MREIKFRAWNPRTNKMIDLHKATPFALHDEMTGDGLYIPFDSGLELMQYTGLKDASKRELYDGDFFRDGEGMLFLISWDEGSLQWYAQDVIGNSWSMSLGEFMGLSVFYEGNIYENKNLLKEFE